LTGLPASTRRKARGNQARRAAALLHVFFSFQASVFAVDPNDPATVKPVTYTKFRSLQNCGCIHAQRGLDDVTHEESDVLGKVLEIVSLLAC
jgi:hypothetical protein